MRLWSWSVSCLSSCWTFSHLEEEGSWDTGLWGPAMSAVEPPPPLLNWKMHHDRSHLTLNPRVLLLCSPVPKLIDLQMKTFANNLTKYNPVPSLEDLPGYKKRLPVKTLYPLSRECPTTVFVIDSRNFHCTNFPYHTPNSALFQLPLLVLTPSILPK